jgi:nucleotide-binding universal stress UspA family protein
MITIDYKKIMIATDGSDCSNLAIEKGIELARLSGGTVYAVYVMSTAYLFDMDGGAYPSVGTNPYWESIREALKNQGQQAVDYIKDMGEAKGINVKPILLEGNPSN